MPTTAKNTLKSWFITLAKPLQGQYWAWMDSFWHKDELIPMERIEELINTINSISGILPITGTIVAPGGSIELPAGRVYREIVLTGTGTVSIGTTPGGIDIYEDIIINDTPNYVGLLNLRPTSALTLYFTNTNTLAYEIFRS